MAKHPDVSELEPFVRLLASAGVEFVVVGGQAEALYGSARATYDVDLCYRRTPDNLRRLVPVLRDLDVKLRGAPLDLPFIVDERTLAFGSNFTFDSRLGPLDLLGHVEPIGGFEEVAERAEVVAFDEFALKVIALDDLIQVKQHINRVKDRDSLINLLAIRRVREEQAPAREEGGPVEPPTTAT